MTDKCPTCGGRLTEAPRSGPDSMPEARAAKAAQAAQRQAAFAELRADGHSRSVAAAILGVSRPTARRYERARKTS
jgi:DNA-binding CsgD family transcriptional regulator